MLVAPVGCERGRRMSADSCVGASTPRLLHQVQAAAMGTMASMRRRHRTLVKRSVAVKAADPDAVDPVTANDEDDEDAGVAEGAAAASGGDDAAVPAGTARDAAPVVSGCMPCAHSGAFGNHCYSGAAIPRRRSCGCPRPSAGRLARLARQASRHRRPIRSGRCTAARPSAGPTSDRPSVRSSSRRCAPTQPRR